jgi:hypothetical protein
VEREISSGAMLGIVLLALAAVIGLGFGVFAIAKGVANEGTVNVQDSLSTVSLQVFMDYDQKIITGTQAISGMKNFEGKPYAVLINTKAILGNQKIASKADRPDGNGANFAQDGKFAFLNYNAILAAASTGAASTPVVGGEAAPTYSTVSGPTLTLKNGTYIAPAGFVLTAGNVTYDNATGGIFKSGNAEFIPSSTKFQANLIKDQSNAIIGIALRQL